MAADQGSEDRLPHFPLYHARLVGTVQVPLLGADAFNLFTPVGEKVWAHGWDPLFPATVEDDSQPGTVFEIAQHGARSVWIVCGRKKHELIHYARVIPGQNAGTVIVRLESKPTGSVATIEYELTALTLSAAIELSHFASNYPRFLATWEESIAAACRDS